jgi:phosphatidylglycerophosphatase A
VGSLPADDENPTDKLFSQSDFCRFSKHPERSGNELREGIMNPTPPLRRNAIAFLIATWFGCGLAPAAPGTAGSLAGLFIAIALNSYGGYGRATLLALTTILLAPGIWAAGVVAHETNKPDPQTVVVDEVIGQWLTLAGTGTFNWKAYIAALVLFRVLDFKKPLPARQLEYLPSGWGIVADDVIVGLYGALIMFVLDRCHLFSWGT